MARLRRNYDFAIFALVVSAFVFVACQRLGAVPVYETDESFTLQVPYEMLERGKLALPMYRYLGGNIENVWHSYTPLYFVLLSGFLKLFGIGMLQGRAFNLITAVLTLLMVYLIGRKMFDWRAGLIATLMLVSDLTFLERSRLLRNDYAAAMFALLAFYLYQHAEERRSSRLLFASGLAAGAGVMCHTNILYMVGVIGVLILLKKGWQAFTSRDLYIFISGALAVMAYEIVYDLIDLKNFLLQNRQDTLHFGMLEGGWWQNFLRERLRYMDWYSGGAMFPTVPRTLLHLFQALTVMAICYLIIRAIWRRNSDDPRLSILIATLFTVLFIALLGGNKELYYIAHLAPWFALCAGILVVDGFAILGRMRSSSTAWASPVRIAVSTAVVVAIMLYGYQLAKQNANYLEEVRDPNLVSFEEIARVLKDTVPEDLCPVAIKAPVIWLAFPEKDRCFADIEARMAEAVDIDGKDYALVSRPRNLRNLSPDVDQKYHLLGELLDTPYGTLAVYYTGRDPRYLALPERRYHFFNKFRGHVSDEQIAVAREIWSSSDQSLDFNPEREMTPSSFIYIASVELAPNMIYQVVVDGSSPGEWELVVVDERTGEWVKRVNITGGELSRRAEDLFRNPNASRIKLGVRPLNRDLADSIRISRISIREVGQL